jgi:hypothetical protein
VVLFCVIQFVYMLGKPKAAPAMPVKKPAEA